MATALEPKTKAAPPKHESFVEQQIARVQGRVRAQDAGTAALLFLIFTLAYGLAMALADKSWELSPSARLLAFGVFALIAAVLLGWALLCLVRRVNPYYAARQLEETLPDAKNSLVNWLDLRAEQLPPVIHTALGLRAARDLKKAHPDEAVSTGRTWVLAAILGGLLLTMLIFFIMGPQQFTSLMQRVFLPFQLRNIDTVTRIEMIEPAEGDTVVPPNRAVTFRARIDGRVPPVNQQGAPTLLWRYTQADPFISQPLDKDFDDSWTWTLPADQVINQGLFYKVTAGDAETPEYHVRISPIPQVRAVDVTYHYRAYERKKQGKTLYPIANFKKLHARRGTEVTLRVQTNCEVKSGQLDVTWDNKGRIEVPAEVKPDDPGTLHFPKFVLEASGSFRFMFTSRDGKSNIDRSPYPIIVFEEKPSVEILKPKDVKLPANGTLQVEGMAHSTIGIKKMVLRMRPGNKLDNKQELEPKPYRPLKSFKLADGSYPPALDYRDYVALEKLKTAKGQPFPPTAGMTLTYWLEAVDSSDYPDPNGHRGTSPEFTVTILDPEKDQNKQKQDRDKARQQQKQHDQKQDQQLEQQNNASTQPGKGTGNTTDQKKDTPEQQKQLKSKEEEAKKAAEQIQKQLEKQKSNTKQPPTQPNTENKKPSDPNAQKPEKQQGNRPQSKNEQPNENNAKANQPQPDSKSGKSTEKAPQPQSKDDKQSSKKSPGQEKNAGNKGPEKSPGKSKGDGQKSPNGGQDQKQKGGEAKDQGKKGPDAGQPGAGKQESAGGGPKEEKAGAKSGSPKQQDGQAKDDANEGQPKQVSAAKKGPSQGKEKRQLGKAKGAENKRSEPSSAQKNNTPNGSAGAEKFKEPTPEEIARLARDLKSGDPKTQRQAEERLRQICRECQNPGARDSAGEALHANNKTEMKAKGAEGSDKNTAKAESKEPGDMKSGEAGQGAAKSAPPDAPKGAGKGQGPGERDPNHGEIAKNKGGKMKPGGWGGAASAFDNQSKPKAPHEGFFKRGGNLTLEDLRNLRKMTPEQLKKAGINGEDWQRFARAMDDYEKDLQKRNVQTGKDRLQGGTSQLSSSGPAQLQPNSNRKTDPLDYSRGSPPPEFREAQSRFTAGAAQKKR